MAKTKTTGYKLDKDGLWAIDTKVKVDGEWRHFYKKGYATLSSAKADFERAKAEFIKTKTANKCDVVLFEDLVSEYEKMREIIVSDSTLEHDRNVFKVHMFPMFKGQLIGDVFRPGSIMRWYKDLLSNTKCTNQRKSKIITRMKDLLKFAYMHKYITADMYQDCDINLYQVKYNNRPLKERVVWTSEEEKAFIEAVSTNKKDSLMFRVFLATSPRLGEFLGMQPRSFDYEKSKITIDQQVKNVAGKGAVLTDRLKTHDSYRTIVIPRTLADELKDYIDTMHIRPEQYLWYSTSRTKPISRTGIRRLFNAYCDLAGVRRMNLHALRHNQAVKLASVCRTGEEIEIAAKRLGHSPSMFMNTYANHANDKTESELLKRLDA